VISAENIWGILHGLTTFGSMIRYRPGTNSFRLPVVPVTIRDLPDYAWRGLLLDTSRHFIPVDAIKRTIRGMELSKLNVLSWHMVDAASFPYQSEKFPELSLKGAYTPEAHYTAADIRDIVEYARERGIRIVPEIDTPAHTLSLALSHPEWVITCPQHVNGQDKLDNREDIPTLDPTHPELYTFLFALYDEIADLFPEPIIHTGGDEVKMGCWESDGALQSRMKKAEKTWTLRDWESYHHLQLRDHLKQRNITQAVWEDVYLDASSGALHTHPNAKLLQGKGTRAGTGTGTGKGKVAEQSSGNSDIAFVWLGEKAIKLLTTAHISVVNLFGYYVDMANPLGRITNPDRWFLIDLTDLLTFDPREGLSKEQQEFVLGGAMGAWSENMNEHNLDSRLWQRGVAVVERLWRQKKETEKLSAPTVKGIQMRADQFLCHLRVAGVMSGPLLQSHCQLNSKVEEEVSSLLSKPLAVKQERKIVPTNQSQSMLCPPAVPVSQEKEKDGKDGKDIKECPVCPPPQVIERCSSSNQTAPSLPSGDDESDKSESLGMKKQHGQTKATSKRMKFKKAENDTAQNEKNGSADEVAERQETNDEVSISTDKSKKNENATAQSEKKETDTTSISTDKSKKNATAQSEKNGSADEVAGEQEADDEVSTSTNVSQKNENTTAQSENKETDTTSISTDKSQKNENATAQSEKKGSADQMHQLDQTETTINKKNPFSQNKQPEKTDKEDSPAVTCPPCPSVSAVPCPVEVPCPICPPVDSPANAVEWQGQDTTPQLSIRRDYTREGEPSPLWWIEHGLALWGLISLGWTSYRWLRPPSPVLPGPRVHNAREFHRNRA
jgi:hexosaminidase